MIEIRSIGEHELPWFAALSGTGPDFATSTGHGRPHERLERSLRSLWASGASRPAWSFVVESHGRAVGRAAYTAEPIAPAIPTLEHRLIGLWLADWSDAGRPLGMRLIDETAARVLPADRPWTLDLRVHRESADHVDERLALARACGFSLFQEKQGFVWRDRGQTLDTPAELMFRSLAEVGLDRYVDVMAAAATGQLDRAAHHYVSLCGPRLWAETIASYLTPEDEASWLIAEAPDGDAVGYVAVGAFDEPGAATIVYIGVVEGRRGRRHVDALLARAAIAARARGFTHIVSDVDTQNVPMLAAMDRAGHERDARPWHVWHFRREGVPG